MAKKESTTPPPTIGKIGPYTVFLTPPSPSPITISPELPTPPPLVQPPTPPVVQPPPQQFSTVDPDNSLSAFFRNALLKVQNAHSSLDEHVAHWFGLNQSKYQWALDDYYESKGGDQVEAKAAKEISSKV